MLSPSHALAGLVLGLCALCAWAVRHFGRRAVRAVWSGVEWRFTPRHGGRHALEVEVASDGVRTPGD